MERSSSRPLRPAALALCVALLVAGGGAAGAGERGVLGWSHVVTNDSIGEFRDRWQTSHLQGSLFLGPRGVDPADFAPGEVLELRVTSQIVTPESLTAPASGDRLFAGSLGLELYTHGRIGAAEISAGAGVFAVGPQTGSFRLQARLHEVLGFPVPVTDGNEIGDGWHPSGTVELGRSFGDALRLRPFAELRGGYETLARIGVDATLGGHGSGSLMVRDPVTGHRLRGLPGSEPRGLSLVGGADVAWVGDSALLPASSGYEPLTRRRFRLGVHWQGESLALFYGAAWLSPEFEGQREGQVVGALQLRVRF